MGVSGRTSDDAFAAFARSAGTSLYRTAWLLCGDTDIAKELTQAALVKAYVAWGRIDPTTALPYTRKILVRENVDRFRRRREYPVAETPERADPTSAEDAFAERERVAGMLATLPIRQRQVLVLRFYDDLSEAQIADALGIPVGTVKSTAHRALESLRTHYAHALEGELA